MSTQTNLGIDSIATQEATKQSYKSSNSTSTFDKVLNTTSYLSATMGPAIAETVSLSSGTDTGLIVSGAINAAASGSPSNLSTYGGGSYSTGGASFLTDGSISATASIGTDSSDSSSTLSEMETAMQSNFTNQLAMTGLQMNLNNQGIYVNAVSNIEQNRASTIKSMIANLRGG